LTPERNASCPCGSGKKYKKCCGLNDGPSRPDNLSFNRAIAYKGSIGRLREDFCLNYAALKKTILLDIESNQKQDAESIGKLISCSKGCTPCCSLYIAASLQECECIAHYLYSHDETFHNFLRAYDVWLERITRIKACFNRINSLHGKTLLSQESVDERRVFNAELSFYESRNIACPFLFEGECSIHDVRPYVCASVVSLSPPDWCKLGHSNYMQVVYLKTDMQIEKDMPYFVLPRSKIFFSNMPLLVHAILEGGYDTLSSVPGLENLKKAAIGRLDTRG
jgi:Fe-S-cluster containining protein